jgi:hypothetical protein
MFSPFAIFLLRTYVLSIPYELEEAAQVDGARRWQTFFHVVMPMMRPGLLTVAIIVGLNAWNEFVMTWGSGQSEPLRQPFLQASQRSGSLRSAVCYPALRLDIALRCGAATAQLRRNPLRSLTQRLQPQHRCDLVRRTHLVSPQQFDLRGTCPRFHLHLDLS